MKLQHTYTTQKEAIAMGAQLAAVEKPFDAARTGFEALVARLDDPETWGMPHSAVESIIERDGREILRRLLEDHVALRAQGFRGPTITGADGQVRTHCRLGTRHLVSVFGEIEVTRVGCHAPEHSTLFPVDAALNLPPTLYSHGLERRLASLVGRMSFEAAMAEVETSLGVAVPKRQAEEIAGRWAIDFDAFYGERVRAELPAAVGELLILSVDGKGIVMRTEDLREATRRAASTREHKLKRRLSKGEKRNAKRMATVSAIYSLAQQPRGPEDIVRELRGTDPGQPKVVRPRPEAKRVWASIENSMESVIDELFAEANRRDPLHLKTWVAVVDGNKTQLDLVRKAAAARGVALTVVLDVIHVIEYLWKAARVFNEETSVACEAWVNERLLRVLQGKSSEVAAGIRRSATKRGLNADERKPADTCARYLIKYRAHLRYDQYLAAGFPIASGIIEGACRHLVKDRMDITGARWSLAGAEAVLRLRSLLASHDFADYCAFHERRERESNHDIHYPNQEPPALTPPLRAGRPALRLVK
jgi:hypothetical protein